MKAIIIEEKRFEEEFKALLDSLDLSKFKEKERANHASVEDLHRMFVYRICESKDKILRSDVK